MNKTRELRWVLIGRTTMRDGIIHVSRKGDTLPLFAGGNGAFSALFFGLMQRSSYFQVPDDADLNTDVFTALGSMGTPVKLYDTPNVPACLHRNTMADQCVFTADMTEDGLLELSVFQGRSLFGTIGMVFSLKKLASFLPGSYTHTAVSKKSRKELRLEKKQKRIEKKVNREARRKQGKTPPIDLQAYREQISSEQTQSDPTEDT